MADDHASHACFDNLPPEVLLVILNKLNIQERFNLCLMGEKFANQVLSFDRLYAEKTRNRLKRRFQHIMKNFCDYSDEDLFRRMRNEKLVVKNVHLDLMMYVSEYHPNLVDLEIKLLDFKVPFELKFQNLEILKLDKRISTSDSTLLNHLAALPKLRVLTLMDLSYYSLEGEIRKLKTLETLELYRVSNKKLQLILAWITDCLENIYFQIHETSPEGKTTDIQVLLDNCPRLKSVGMKDASVSEEQMSALTRKVGRQLQYLHIFNCFKESGSADKLIADLTNFDSIELKAFDVVDSIDVDQFVRFMQKHGKKIRRLYCTELDSSVWLDILDICPQLQRQDYWYLPAPSQNEAPTSVQYRSQAACYMQQKLDDHMIRLHYTQKQTGTQSLTQTETPAPAQTEALALYLDQAMIVRCGQILAKERAQALAKTLAIQRAQTLSQALAPYRPPSLAQTLISAPFSALLDKIGPHVKTLSLSYNEFDEVLRKCPNISTLLLPAFPLSRAIPDQLCNSLRVLKGKSY